MKQSNHCGPLVKKNRQKGTVKALNKQQLIVGNGLEVDSISIKT